MAEEAPTGGERTENATAKRREDFRKKGQVAQSKEVQNAVLFTIGLLFWFFYMPAFWEHFSTLIKVLFASLDSFQATSAGTMELAYFLIKETLILLAPLFCLIVLVGIASSFFQIGWLFTTEPLTPDITKLNPISGFGRMFSKKSIIELVKSLLKVLLVGYIGYSTIFDYFPEALVQVDTGIWATLTFLGTTAALIMAKICALLIFIAFLDFLWVKYDMEQKMMMTKQEQKEEFKASEGDPQVKAQIRSIQQQMARKRMMADIPTADVIVTNPTHISVALRYKQGQDESPVIVAKGADHLAMRIREIAREYQIPIIENPPVARVLHKIELGGNIPEDMFKAVAEILAHVYSLKGKRRP